MVCTPKQRGTKFNVKQPSNEVSSPHFCCCAGLCSGCARRLHARRMVTACRPKQRGVPACTRIRNPMPNDPPRKCGPPPIFAAAQACARLCRAATFPRFGSPLVYFWLFFGFAWVINSPPGQGGIEPLEGPGTVTTWVLTRFWVRFPPGPMGTADLPSEAPE